MTKKQYSLTPISSSISGFTGVRAPLVAAVFVYLAAITAVAVGGTLAGLAPGWVATIVSIMVAGGLGAVAILAPVLRRQAAAARDQEWLTLASMEDRRAVLVEAGDGAAIYANQLFRAVFPANEGLSIERYLGAPAGDFITMLRARARSGEQPCEIWPMRGDGPPQYDISARRVGAGDILWTVQPIGNGVAGRMAREVEYLRDTLNIGADGLFVLDAAGRFVFANKVLDDWLESSSEGSNGKDLSKVGRSIVDYIDGDLDIAALGAPMTVVRLRDGEEELLITGQWLNRDDNDDDPLFCGAATKAANIGQYNADLFERAPIAIGLLDPSLRIIECNDTFGNLIGEVNPHGAALTGFVVDDQQDAVEKHLLAAMTGTRPPMEARLLAKEGLVVLIYVAPIQLAGDDAGVIVYLIDTTRQKILEQQFAQSQKMQAVGQLAGGIAHDFNNLLTAMIGFCDLLLQRHGAGDQSFADIMQIKQNANRAARLVRQLLAFSRQQMLEPRPLDVTDALAELMNLLQRLLGEQIEMRMEHGRDLGMVKVDEGQFDQVIINLAVNARDAMSKGGTLTINTERRVIAAPVPIQGEDMQPGDYVVITVRDTGVGIAKQNLERIFDPFFTTKDVGAGTGLGLSTVYGIISQTGGHISVESDGVERGAVFTIYLKRLDEKDMAGHGEPETETDRDVTGGGTVLLVEDEDPVRLFGARALRSKGYKVVEARNGEAAIDILGAEPFDLLITDMVMPKVDGATLIKVARAENAELPVICISGYTDESVLAEVEALDRVLFLPKPFSLKQLAGKVKEALDLT
jgi:two-component system, cell cycle sensor histidine kinase and response regulator CckA